MLLLNASGCLDALTAPGGRAAARRVRDEDGHARAARGQPAGADRRDRLRDAELDRSREPRARARSSPRRCRAARALGVPIWVSVGGFSRARVRRDVRSGSRTSTIELNLSCPNVDEAPESAAEIVARLPRGDRTCRSTRSFRRRPGTSPRSRGRSRRRAPTASRSSTRCAALALDDAPRDRGSRAAPAATRDRR